LGRGGAAQTPEQHHFADQNAMVAALGAVVVEHLQQAIEQRGHALLAVSGGKTPAALFDWLSQQTLDWSKVIITLADDRWLPPDHADSNTPLATPASTARCGGGAICATGECCANAGKRSGASHRALQRAAAAVRPDPARHGR
jgi:hypothetical protein